MTVNFKTMPAIQIMYIYTYILTYVYLSLTTTKIIPRLLYIIQISPTNEFLLVGACRGFWISNEGTSTTRRILTEVFEGNM